MTRKRTSKSSPRKRTSSRKTTSRSRSSARKRSASTGPLIQLSRHQWSIIGGILLIIVAGIAILSGFSISRGKLTDWLWNNIWSMFGYGGLIIPAAIGLAGLYFVMWGMEQPPRVRWERVGGAGLLFLGIEGVLHLIYLASHPAAAVEQVAALGEGGGYVGGGLIALFDAAVGRIGSWLFCVALVGIGLVLFSRLTFAQTAHQARTSFRAWQARRRAFAAARNAPIPSYQPTPEKPIAADLPAELAAADQQTPAAEAQVEHQPLDASQPGLFYGDAVRMAAANYHWQLPKIQDILEPGTENAAADIQIREQVEIIEHTLRSFGVPGRVVEINPGPVITQFGVEPQYIEHRNGRRVKVKVGQISSLSDDLALALAARSIRIEAPVPGKGYVGIEVPNAEVSIVSLRDAMESPVFNKIKSQLRIGLGQDVSGTPIAADLTQMPHLLIAGTTGSGKSVCVNSIISCLLLNNTPNQLRMLMVDPKRVELTGYNGIPHLLTQVIVDLEKVVGTLQWVTREMDNRYRQFAEAGARNIRDYNRVAGKNGNGQLPYIVVIIDELADLMLLAPDETERTVCRLAQMARATGIHLIIATQRPSVDVVTGLIKANFPARVAFAVASSTDSRVILDSTGAEKLLGRGDMLLMTPDSAQPMRMQGCFVSDTELRRLVEHWRRQRLTAVQAGKTARAARATAPKPVEETIEEPEAETVQVVESETIEKVELEPEPKTETVAEKEPSAPTVQQPLWEEIIQLEQAASQQDELFDQAVAIVRELGKASVSLLQRRLRIGYTRAARLIDEMEARKIVGPHPGGSRRREVLPPPEKEPKTAEKTA